MLVVINFKTFHIKRCTNITGSTFLTSNQWRHYTRACQGKCPGKKAFALVVALPNFWLQNFAIQLYSMIHDTQLQVHRRVYVWSISHLHMCQNI